MSERPRFPFDPPRYPDRIAASVPLGFKERAKRAAQREGLSFGEFVRKALEARLSAIEAR